MSVFKKDAGRILSPEETKDFTGAYRQRKLDVGLKSDEYVRSEFFGSDLVQKLLDQEGCVGLRIHHAKRWEDENGSPTDKGKGQLKPRLVLTGVDTNGKDIPIYTDKAGLKDMPSNGGGGSVGDGLPCPQHCENNT